jgi:hypothetical protein
MIPDEHILVIRVVIERVNVMDLDTPNTLALTPGFLYIVFGEITPEALGVYDIESVFKGYSPDIT